MTGETKMIRDALGDVIPQTLNADGKAYTPLANGEVSGVDFSKYKLLRDALGAVLPYQFFDVEQGKFVPGSLGGSGGGGDTGLIDTRLKNLEDYFYKHFMPIEPHRPVRIIDFTTYENDSNYIVTHNEYPWAVDTAVTPYVLKSTNQGVGNSVSKVNIHFSTIEVIGKIEFEYYCSSEEKYDNLSIKVDGSELSVVNKMVDWVTYSKVLAPGAHTIELTYSKDESRDEYQDTAFVRSIKITG